MRHIPPVLFVVATSLSVGCNLGRALRPGGDVARKPKQSWNEPAFADRGDRRESEDSPAALVARARAAGREGRTSEARLLYERVLSTQPTNPDAHNGLAILADRAGDYARAEEHYLTALRTRPNDPDLLNDMGYSLLRQKRYDESEKFLRRALAIDPDHTLATSQLGHVMAAKGDYPAALDLFSRVGTPDQVRAELARYFPEGPPARIAESSAAPRPIPDDFEPASPNADLADLSPREIVDRMNRERLEAIARRRERQQHGFDHLRDRSEEPRTSEVAHVDEPRETPSRTGDQPLQLDPQWPADTRGEELVDGSHSGDAASAGRRRMPDLWPESTAGFDDPAPRERGDVVQVGFDDDRSPRWPSTEGAPRGSSGRTSAESRRRAAMLGLGAGSVMPLTITPRRPVGPHPTPPPSTPSRSAERPEHAAPPWNNAPDASSRLREPDGFRDDNPIRDEPANWPESASIDRAGGPIPTTAPVASDPALFRAASDDAHAAARPAYPPSPSEEVTWDRESEARRGASIDRRAAAAEFAADRRDFHGGGIAHPGFPDDFGPPSHTLRPRSPEEESRTVRW